MVNGLVCKVLNLGPRHQQIVAEITGSEYASILTMTIGLLEIGMAVWILSRVKTRLNALVQIVVILVMNILEFILVPELLLFGKLNSLFALIFTSIIYYNEFVVTKTVRN